ncbi:head decoration protein [Zavarzinella formosa]|uniref:head decoration protein n=1 Tax=Zavarzinella formosa TaxID=360055 RepID=UPI00030135A7|nr:head decoration protein [Zavarzinella formosa]
MSQLSSLIDPFVMPGMFDPVETTESEFVWGTPENQQRVGIIIASTATDANNTPTTTLRRGLVMGQISATKKYKQYDPTATDGSQVARGFLMTSRNLYNSLSGTNGDRTAHLLIAGSVKVDQLIGFDEQARRTLNDRFIYDDFRTAPGIPTSIEAKTADYTVTAADSGKQFTTTGAAGAVNFTLPACAKGYRFRFVNIVNQNMTITAPSGKLVTFNNAAATSVAFSTSGNKIGAAVEITTDETGTKYIALLFGANTPTVA